MMIALATTLMLVFFSVVYAAKKIYGSKNVNHAPPEADGALPIFGHIHLLGSRLLHQALAGMADKYGPIFSIRIGIRRIIVVSGWEVVQQCYTVNDRAFATRPTSVALKKMGYQNTMLGFAPYGPYWRYIRKLSVVHLLSARRMEQLQHVQDSETKYLIQGLHKQWIQKGHGAPILVDMTQVFGYLTFNIISRKVTGRRYSSDDPELKKCLKTYHELSRLLGAVFISDAIPALGWLDVINGNVGAMKKTGKEIEDLLYRSIQDHRQRQATGNIEENDKDFIEVMLSVMEDSEMEVQEVDEIITGTCMTLIFGGNDMTLATLIWALSLLMNNPNELKKLQEELEAQVGNHRQVEESDIKKLIFLQAVVKETLRLYPAGPLSVPREALEDCVIAGYHITRGTRLFTNLWKLHRDASIWRKPLEFIPERFLCDHHKVEYTGQDFEFLPFGSGRRISPGVSFALHSIHLTLARLLLAFEPTTMSHTLVDMTDSPGLVSHKETPLKIFLAPQTTVQFY